VLFFICVQIATLREMFLVAAEFHAKSKRTVSRPVFFWRIVGANAMGDNSIYED